MARCLGAWPAWPAWSRGSEEKLHDPTGLQCKLGSVCNGKFRSFHGAGQGCSEQGAALSPPGPPGLNGHRPGRQVARNVRQTASAAIIGTAARQGKGAFVLANLKLVSRRSGATEC